jgi:hypothetical protein
MVYYIHSWKYPLSPGHRLNKSSCFDSGSLSRYLVSKLIHAAVKGNDGCEGRARVMLLGRSRFAVQPVKGLGKDFALGPSRVGRAVPTTASIRWWPQTVLSLSGYAGDAILDVASYTKKPVAEERIFPNHRCCLSNFFNAYDRAQTVLRSAVTSSVIRSNPTDQ